MPSRCLCACVSVTHFLNVCVCVFAHVRVAQSCHHKQRRGGGDTSNLNGIRALWGLRDNTGLTDPTKWPIMSQWRKLGSKKIPNPTTVIPLDQWTHKHTHGEGGGGAVGFRVEVEWWFLLLTTRKEEAEWLQRSNPVKGSHCGESKWPLTTSKEQTEGSRQRTSASTDEMLKLTRRRAGLCVRV